MLAGFCLVLFTRCDKEPEPEIEFVVFSDNAFRSALIELGVDNNADGEICTCEAARVHTLDVSNRDISDMNGIDAFVHLDTLDCSGNLLSTLDVSNNTELEHLNCSNNQLSALDLSDNHHLFEVYCGDNQLSSLHLSSSTYFWTISCTGNQLNSLDVSNNPLLWHFSCRNNQLSSLDLSNNPELTDIDLGGNQFTSLDISHNTKLGTNLVWESIPDIFLDSIPGLFKVCVWEMPFPPEGVEIETSGSPNLYFTTACSK